MSTSPSSTVAGGANPLSRRAQLWSALGTLAQSPWFAYGVLALLQLRIVWGIWNFRDLSSGDTSGYFLAAFRWFSAGKVGIVWSGLYTMYYGSLMVVTRDPYAVTILHRLVIVFAASLLVLAVFRRLLPP